MTKPKVACQVMQKEEMENTPYIASDFNDFVDKITEAERTVLNTPIGQELTQSLLSMKLESNPNMTVEEWQDTKSEFLTYLFAMFVRETPEAMQELGHHVWNELRNQ